jgi:formate hydrogenlyase transcriptional activator
MPISHITPGSTELERLQYNLECSRILVDVTNTVIAKRDLNELAQELSDELHRSFKCEFVSLDLFDPENNQLHCYSADFQSKPFYFTQHLPLNSAFIDVFIQNKVAVRLNPAQTQIHEKDDPYLVQIEKSRLNDVSLLPLVYDNNILGIFRLATDNRSTFSEANMALLEQVAARISIGLNNALAYQEISRLKDKLLNENQYLTEEIRSFESFGEIVSESTLMAQVLEQVEMVANSDCSVLILGETGTGKELIARAIHKLSRRNQHTMVKMNCAAIPSGLMESDLFGHEKGAYTGATAQRIGRFELAHKGTLFLDEVGDIPLELQPKLLRVLQEREIERVGGNKVIPVDVRVIAATNCDLQQMVLDKQYRSDLYYRLNVFPIVIPPLRQRPEDIPLLAKFFTQKIAHRMNRHIDSIPSDALKRLLQLPWEGNVRELENIIERAVILTKGNTLNLQLDELPPVPAQKVKKIRTVALHANNDRVSHLDDDSEQERREILRVLKETNGIVAGPKGAAERLGLKRTTLLSRMQRLGISVKDVKESV